MNALLERLPIHPHATAPTTTRDAWLPLFHLVWLLWMIAAPWAYGEPEPGVVAVTGASLPTFLVLYFRAWYGDRARIVWNTGAIAVLGLAMVVANTCWSYVIYASVLIPYCTTPRRAVAWLAALMAALAVVAHATGFPPPTIVFAIGMCTIVALLTLVGRLNQLRDATLRLSHDEVRRLAATAERERIGRDLHDLLGHTLSTIAVKSELARRRIDRDLPAARDEIADIERIARAALAEVRDAVTGIRAAGLAAEVASARLLLTPCDVSLDVRLDELPLPPPVESALALGLREAVTNVARHARARRVTIALRRDGDGALLSIDDDGRGGPVRRGNGLTGVAERLDALGGRLVVAASPAGGTRIDLHAPLGGARSAATVPGRRAAAPGAAGGAVMAVAPTARPGGAA